MKTVFKCEGCGLEDVIFYGGLNVGDSVLLVEKYSANTGVKWYELLPYNGKGVGVISMSDNDARKYHGFCGSYDNVSTFADGVRRIEKIYYVKVDDYDSVTAKFKLSTDLEPDLP